MIASDFLEKNAEVTEIRYEQIASSSLVPLCFFCSDLIII